MEWTTSAKAELERRLRNIADWIEGGGADPIEVADDVRRHVEMELEARGATVVTADQAERLLRQMGLDEVEPEPPAPTRSSTPRRSKAESTKRIGIGVLLAGVILPSAALLVELTTRVCTKNFFDPLPTAGHVVLFGSIILASALLLLHQASDRQRHGRPTALMLGFALVAVCVYCVAFLPMAPLSCLAVLVGFGVFALSPFFALAALLGGFAWLRKDPDGTTNPLGRELWIGACLALVLVLFLEVPPLLTQRGLSQAVSTDPTTRAQGIALLRRFGNEEEILRRCYEPASVGRGVLGRRRASAKSLLGNFAPPHAEDGDITRQQARELYYLSLIHI